MNNEKLDNLVDFYILAHTQVSDKPCRLYSLEVTGAAAAANTAICYDGFSISDELKLTLVATQYVTVQFYWPKGKRFSKGLYIYKGAGTPYISGQYEADK